MSQGALAGIGVLVTRAEHQAGELMAAIENAGGRPIPFPVIDIVGRDASIVKSEIEALEPADIVIYVSTNAVEHGLAALAHGSPSVAAVGPATAASLEAAGVHVDIRPAEAFDSEHLLAEAALADVAGRTVSIVRGETGRELIADTLRKRGARVQYLSVYRRVPHTWSEHELQEVGQAWLSGDIQAVIVMSSAAFGALLDALPSSYTSALRETRLVAPSARVIKTIHERLPGARCVLAPGPQAADIVGALAESLRNDPVHR